MANPPRRWSNLFTALGWWWRGDAVASAKMRAALEEHESALVPPEPVEDPFASEVPENMSGDGRWWLLTLPAENANANRRRQLRCTALSMAWLDLASQPLRAWAVEKLAQGAPGTLSNKGALAALSLLDDPLPAPRAPASEGEKSWALGWLIGISMVEDAKAMMSEGVKLDERAGSLPGWCIATGQSKVLSVVAQDPAFVSSSASPLPTAIRSSASGLVADWGKALKKESGLPWSSETKENLDRTGKIDWSPFNLSSLAQRALEAGEVKCVEVLLAQGAQFEPDKNPFKWALDAEDPDMFRALLAAGVPLDDEGARQATTFISRIDEARRNHPSGRWPALAADMLPLYESAMRVYLRSIKKENFWAHLLTVVMENGAGTRPIEVLVRQNPTKGSWHHWTQKRTQQQSDGSVKKFEKTMLLEAIERSKPDEIDTIVSALVCPKISVAECVHLFTDKKNKPQPLGLYLAALAPGSLKAWLDKAAPNDIATLSTLKATNVITRGKVRLLSEEDDVWCAALRSSAPRLALSALSEKMQCSGVVDKASPNKSPHFLSLWLAATENRWDTLEAAVDYLPIPTWATPEMPERLYSMFNRPLDEAAVEKLLAKWSMHTLRTESGKSILHYAIDRDDKALAKLMVQHGADLDAPDNQGISARQFAQGFDNAKEWDAVFSEGTALRLASSTQAATLMAPQPRGRL